MPIANHPQKKRRNRKMKQVLEESKKRKKKRKAPSKNKTLLAHKGIYLIEHP